MVDNIRALNKEGLNVFFKYIETLKATPLNDRKHLEPPFEILFDDNMSNFVPGNHKVSKNIVFKTNHDIGAYLADQIEMSLPEIEKHRGLWSWLGLYYFHVLCPPERMHLQRNGGVKEWNLYLYRNDWDKNKKDIRHLLWTPFFIVRTYGGDVGKLCLLNSVYEHGDAIEGAMNREDMSWNKSILEAIDFLYVKPNNNGDGFMNKNNTESGVTVFAKDKGGGSLRHFFRLMKQYKLVYDLYSMNKDEILDLLPSEFDWFKNN